MNIIPVSYLYCTSIGDLLCRFSSDFSFSFGLLRENGAVSEHQINIEQKNTHSNKTIPFQSVSSTSSCSFCISWWILNLYKSAPLQQQTAGNLCFLYMPTIYFPSFFFWGTIPSCLNPSQPWCQKINKVTNKKHEYICMHLQIWDKWGRFLVSISYTLFQSSSRADIISLCISNTSHFLCTPVASLSTPMWGLP